MSVVRWDAPEPYEVFFSDRLGGVSDGPYAALNLGLLTDDDRNRVAENRKRLYEAAGADPERVSWPRQVHGGRVVRSNGRGEAADAIWTDERGRALVVVTADCLPVALVRLEGTPALALEENPALRRYLEKLRFVKLDITGRDLAGLGLDESPRVGEILSELRRRKLNGELDGRESELAASRELIGAA